MLASALTAFAAVRYLTLAVLLLYIASPTVHTQERIQAGLGMSLNPVALIGDNSGSFQQPFGVVTWYVPIRIGNYFRVEPEVAYYNNNRREQDNSTRDLETRTNYLRLGMGIFYEWQPTARLGDSSLRVYSGTRLGILSLWTTHDYYDRATGKFLGGDGENRACLYYAVALGGEYMVGKSLGVGIEFQVGNYEFGEPVYRYGVLPPTYPLSSRYTIFASTALVFLRLYL
jgi:hypothetical protein